MLHERFLQAKTVMNTLIEHGFECYFVGGSVRDFLLNLDIKDVDIATNAKPEDVQKIFPHTVPVGIEHGTILVLENNQSFEVTTYRIEDEYEDFRHPSNVEFVDDITLDLSRRDFTINAMAMDLSGNIIDPFNGRQDLENKLIKTVGASIDRFYEDPLRMLRGLRFTSQLGFSLDDEVISALQSNHHLLEKISMERLTEELIKLFKGKYINLTISLFLNTKVYLSLPIFKDNHQIIKKLTNKIVRPINNPSVLFALLHLLEPTISLKDWAKAYKLSNEIKKGAQHLSNIYLSYANHGMTNYLIYETKKEWLSHFYELITLLDVQKESYQSLLNQYQHLPIKKRSELAVTGNDLIQWFPHKKRGEWIGQIINRIEKQVVENKLKNDYGTIESMVKKWEIHGKN
ncbi:CCA tRNA nucleotidyltransferase [Bacillaceae bacterium W0354]